MTKNEFIEEVKERSVMFFSDYFSAINVEYVSDLNEEEFEDHQANVTIELSDKRRWTLRIINTDEGISLLLNKNDYDYIEYSKEEVFIYLFFEECQKVKQLSNRRLCKCK